MLGRMMLRDMRPGGSVPRPHATDGRAQALGCYPTVTSAFDNLRKVVEVDEGRLLVLESKSSAHSNASHVRTVKTTTTVG